jgi:hypothetical protein
MNTISKTQYIIDTFSLAISNRRLIAIEHRGSIETSQVTFQYRASDTGQPKRCTLTVEQFLQRFLQHVLPGGFVKVRYYGFFGATQRARLTLLQPQLAHLAAPEPVEKPGVETSEPQIGQKITCPKCGLPMLFKRDLPPVACRSP